MDDRFDPGQIERRIISFFFEGMKRKLYDLVSLRLGRDSRESEACKAEIRKVVSSVKRSCYGMIAEELETGKDVLGEDDILEIINYVLPGNGDVEGPFWNQMSAVIRYAFPEDHKFVKDYMSQRVQEFVAHRLPQLKNEFDAQWQGAVDYLTRA